MHNGALWGASAHFAEIVNKTVPVPPYIFITHLSLECCELTVSIVKFRRMETRNAPSYSAFVALPRINALIAEVPPNAFPLRGV